MNNVIKFVILGNPKVQKNDLVIRRKKTAAGKLVSFVSHSDKLKNTRIEVAIEMYNFHPD